MSTTQQMDELAERKDFRLMRHKTNNEPSTTSETIDNRDRNSQDNKKPRQQGVRNS